MIVPLAMTLWFSFQYYNLLDPLTTGFAGFDNYVRVLTDVSTRDAIITTIVMTTTVVLISLALGLGIALLLDRQFRGRGIVRTMMIAPFLIVPVAAALLTVLPEGPVRAALEAFADVVAVRST